MGPAEGLSRTRGIDEIIGKESEGVGLRMTTTGTTTVTIEHLDAATGISTILERHDDDEVPQLPVNKIPDLRRVQRESRRVQATVEDLEISSKMIPVNICCALCPRIHI